MGLGMSYLLAHSLDYYGPDDMNFVSHLFEPAIGCNDPISRHHAC